MIGARYTENETGKAVTVDAVFGWPPLGHVVMIVTYPSGRKYAVAEREFALHFTVDLPQELFITAIAIDDRPTKDQLKLQEVP